MGERCEGGKITGTTELTNYVHLHQSMDLNFHPDWARVLRHSLLLGFLQHLSMYRFQGRFLPVEL